MDLAYIRTPMAGKANANNNDHEDDNNNWFKNTELRHKEKKNYHRGLNSLPQIPYTSRKLERLWQKYGHRLTEGTFCLCFSDPVNPPGTKQKPWTFLTQSRKKAMQEIQKKKKKKKKRRKKKKKKTWIHWNMLPNRERKKRRQLK